MIDAPVDRAGAIDAAARLLGDDGQAAAIGESLHARERLASTGIGHGVAFPHGRVPELERSRGAFLRLAPPVDFNAADGEPVDLLLAMAVPEHALQEHLQQLAELAERFGDPRFRERLREAANVDELRECLLAPADPPRRAAEAGR
ncbi:hypothetical protein N799_01925 [Lysobacter arseniciresistens ZS79]|uniref:PTS EIIA type-2 domain-containing protein n=1 Tax=Lysobacter arseniciresistens ZS79 TaxID=913325 RepID=A0A0A0F2B4_9GAMM|nr:hypothetical protein N799_01925 [Lysobacter arseniciresistens ZS79]